LTDLAAHLRDWEASSAVRREMRPADLDRDLIAPAKRLAAELPGGYVEGFEARTAELVGSELPFVAAHRDVTAANVMIGSGDRIGLIDWEEAIPETLPLGDLASAAVDFAAASDGYRDRVAAYRHCFEPGGRFTEQTAELIAAAARALGIGTETVRVALEACWLRHADNERATVTDPAADRPFLSIMRRVAARTVG
jgi:phosphotransferase family enzyme